jgi:hypothetical protein
MSIFEMTPQNIHYFKTPASFEHCLSTMGNVPYWNVMDRICYHVHETPTFIIYNHVFIPSTYAYFFDDYFHITNMKKPLYAISHYSVKELEMICNRLHLPIGKKRDMYDNITSIFKKN